MTSTHKHKPPLDAKSASIVHSFEDADHPKVDLSVYRWEDWIALAFFWVMAALVFLQFFTRYVLNDSFAWTEELAVYCLIAVVFIGSSMCVRRHRHIVVDVLYHYLPERVGFALSTLVDIARTAFFLYSIELLWRYNHLIGNEPMTTIEWDKSLVYWIVWGGFVLMAARSLWATWTHLRRGHSPLTRPEAYETE